MIWINVEDVIAIHSRIKETAMDYLKIPQENRDSYRAMIKA